MNIIKNWFIRNSKGTVEEKKKKVEKKGGKILQTVEENESQTKVFNSFILINFTVIVRLKNDAKEDYQLP